MPHQAGAGSFAAHARHQAAQILSRPPYTEKPARFPDPLAGVLRAIGRGFVWVFGRPARWLWHHLLAPSFHGIHVALGAGGWIVALVLALGLGVLVGVILVRRRARIAPRPAHGRLATTDEDLSGMERAAEQAEANGDNELAVRLRFQFGLARLEARGAIADRLTMTSRQMRRTLQSPVFDELAARHESITYARKPATSRDVTSARDGWVRLLGKTPVSEGERSGETVGSPK